MSVTCLWNRVILWNVVKCENDLGAELWSDWMFVDKFCLFLIKNTASSWGACWITLYRLSSEWRMVLCRRQLQRQTSWFSDWRNDKRVLRCFLMQQQRRRTGRTDDWVTDISGPGHWSFLMFSSWWWFMKNIISVTGCQWVFDNIFLLNLSTRFFSYFWFWCKDAPAFTDVFKHSILTAETSCLVLYEYQFRLNTYSKFFVYHKDQNDLFSPPDVQNEAEHKGRCRLSSPCSESSWYQNQSQSVLTLLSAAC